ncbi:MAG: molybdenum cofactor guanylyltransferase [Spirochaetes bacterium]|nr:molybdenum cofactor guanylyltransferase [Spirochaetota bacterium]
MPIKDITAFVIAGGKSTRFGQDKLLYKYNGMPLLECVTVILKKIFSSIIIITNEAEKYAYLGFETYPDLLQDVGPIAGVYTALIISRTEKNFCVAGDLPFLNADFIEYMISVSDDFDVTVPVIDGFYESLHAVYSKNCVKYIKALIEKGSNQIFRFYENCMFRKVEKSEIQKFADPALIFKNINYFEDI